MRGEGIVPVMEVGNSGGGFGNGFGNNGDWAWIIILFLIFGNGRGFGNGFGGGGGIGENYVLATDFATIERKLDGINNGICDATFALNNTINQGFFGVQNSLTQGFGGLNTALLQGNYALSSQLADCCCKTQRAIDGINYNMAQNTCAITNNATMNTRDIIDAVNTNYRALHEELVANKLEMKNERIAEQQNEINALRLAASQERQNNYLISQLKPCPEPAYLVNGPTPVNFPTNCCGQVQFSNNCGCGNY
jgi:hypothetical protein